MMKKRSWIALAAIPLCLASALIVGTKRVAPPSAGGVIDPTCNSSSPCIQYTNKSSGPGIEGLSLLGDGALGITKFNSTSNANGKSGLLGQDLSTTGTFDSGVTGLSVNGFGVVGSSTNNDAVRALSTNGVGVGANSATSYGVFASTQNTSGGVAGVQGNDESSGKLDSGVMGSSINGAGVSAVSQKGVGANVVGGNSASSLSALSIIENSNADLIHACMSGVSQCTATAAGNVFSVGADGTVAAVCMQSGALLGGLLCNPGDVSITGQYLKNDVCVAGCGMPTATSPGHAVVSYVATQSLPTIDDFGEAMMQNGAAYVRLDRAFANVIDQRANYLVFITPEGDSRGLYVTKKSSQGFAVRENMGGHSSLAFSYRIIAKPLGTREQRLPMVTLPKLLRRERPPTGKQNR